MSPRTRPRSKGARRFYLKTLYRSNPPLGLIRIVTIILTVIAVAALLWTAAAQLAVADVIPAGAADFLSDFFTTETAERNTAAWILAGSALLASGLRWYTIKALHTIQDAEDTGQMRDVYTTPRELRVKMDTTRQVQLVLIMIGALTVALASQFNLYPADADTTADTSQPTPSHPHRPHPVSSPRQTALTRVIRPQNKTPIPHWEPCRRQKTHR